MDYYEVLGIKKDARTEEVASAFESLLSARRARRQKTSDLHAAIAVLSDPVLRAAYDRILNGGSSWVTGPKNIAGEAALLVRDAVSEVDLEEVIDQTWELTLKAVVVVSRTVAKGSDLTGSLSRRLQRAASDRLRARAVSDAGGQRDVSL